MQQVSRQASCWSVLCPLFCVHRLSAADVIPHVAWIDCVGHPPVKTLVNPSLTPPVPKDTLALAESVSSNNSCPNSYPSGPYGTMCVRECYKAPYECV